MAKIYEHKWKVRDYECDSQGVVNNANYLHYYEMTRHEMMEACGIRLRDLTDADILPVVRNANLSYKNPLKGSDEFLSRISIERQGLRYLFTQEIFRLPEMTLCNKALIEVVCIVNGKVGMPKLFDDAFAEYIIWKEK